MAWFIQSVHTHWGTKTTQLNAHKSFIYMSVNLHPVCFLNKTKQYKPSLFHCYAEHNQLYKKKYLQQNFLWLLWDFFQITVIFKINKKIKSKSSMFPFLHLFLSIYSMHNREMYSFLLLQIYDAFGQSKIISPLFCCFTKGR